MTQELFEIKRDIANYFSQNKTKYDALQTLKESLVNLSKDTYQETLDYIQSNKEIFFKDHADSFLFFCNVTLLAEYNFKIMELFLDIIIHFQKDLKNAGVTENEMIIRLDQIEEYDPEYAEKRSAVFLSEATTNEKKFYYFVKDYSESHFTYRNLNYHPSQLYTSIREDDIDTFQSLISKNNYSVNIKIAFAYYERARTIDNDISLIKIAAIYGSINVFKYLWMQDDIIIDDNLILFAYFGRNFDIIHLCEQKCHHQNTCMQAISISRQDLLDYYLENYSDEIEQSYFEIECKQKYPNIEEENNNTYKNLNYKLIGSALFSFHLDIIKECLPKMIFINRNSNIFSDYQDSYILSNSCHDFDLFKFLFKYWKPKRQISGSMKLVRKCIECTAFESFKLCYDYFSHDLNNDDIFMLAMKKNHSIANYLLDLHIDLKTFDLELAFRYYNEDLVVKLFKLNLIRQSNIYFALKKMMQYLSEEMICSLVNRLYFLDIVLMNIIDNFFMNNGQFITIDDRCESNPI